MAVTIPPGVDTFGRLNIIWAPTNTLSIATLDGATAIELAGYLTKDTFSESSETERGTDERVASKTVYEVLGRSTVSVTDLEYVYEPQAAPASPTNKAYDTLKAGTPGFLYVRRGIDVDTALAVGQEGHGHPVHRRRPERQAARGRHG